MPLSDDEARLLAQLEQSLAEEDPDFASTLRGSKVLARSKRVAVFAALGFLAGLGVLFAGAVLAQTWVGVTGFVLMLAAAYLFAVAWSRGQSVRESSGQAAAGATGKSGPSFVDRMEERWQRRQDNDSF